MVTDPWKNVSCADVAARMEAALKAERDERLPPGRTFNAVGDLSVRSVLLAAAHAKMPDSGLKEADLDDNVEIGGFEKLLSRFTKGHIKPVVLCSVTDSMVSGSWGLFEFRLNDRGFIYYRPDWGTGDDESLPVVGAWEPSHDRQARRACILRTYSREWEGRALPPAMGQWAEGDLDMLQEAIRWVIRAEPNAWKMVMDRLRQKPLLGEDESEIIDRVAKSWATDPRRVRELLEFAYAMSNQPNQPPSGTGLRPREMDSLHCQHNQQWTRQLEDQEGHLLLDLYMECITQGKFRRW